MRYLLIIGTFCFSFSVSMVQSQQQRSRGYFSTICLTAKSDAAKLLIQQDNRLEDLVNKHILENAAKKGMPGYRIQIFMAIGKEARGRMYNARASFSVAFPDILTYPVYEEPYYKVRVGDFRTKDEAMVVFGGIKKYFPKAYIVPVTINYPKLD